MVGWVAVVVSLCRCVVVSVCVVIGGGVVAGVVARRGSCVLDEESLGAHVHVVSLRSCQSPWPWTLHDKHGQGLFRAHPTNIRFWQVLQLTVRSKEGFS